MKGEGMRILYARKYVSPRSRALTEEEQETRWISYALKDWTAPEHTLALQLAAREMSDLIHGIGPCNLIPIPSSTGSTRANLLLARQIAHWIPARVIDCLQRMVPVESSCVRHRKNLGGLPPQDHRFKRDPRQWLELAPTYFVDNTSTSGNTLQAAYNAFQFGTGLVFSDASTPHRRKQHVYRRS